MRRRLRFAVLLLAASLAMTGHAQTFEDFLAVLKAGDAQRLEQMLKSAPRPLPRNAKDETALHHANAYNPAGNQARLIGMLIAAGAEINAKDKLGLTPLYWAAGRSCADCVRQLLAAGADVGARSARGRTALHVASPETAPLLLAAGADVGARDAEGSVPLHTNWQDALLAPGVNVRNTVGFTPLHFAALRGDAEAVKWLLARGANPALESTAEYRYKDGILAEQWANEEVIEAGMRPFDIAKREHDRNKWSTGRHRAAWELLDAATPRRGLLRR